MNEALADPAVALAPDEVPLGSGCTSDVFAWSAGWVVKLFRENYPLRHIEHEACIAGHVFALCKGASGFRVPAVGRIVSVGRRSGLLYESANGRPLLRVLREQNGPAMLARCGRQLAELHAMVHRSCADSIARCGQLPLQHETLRVSIEAAPGLSDRIRCAALRSLDEMRPCCQTLCHGDFHPSNVLLSDDGGFAVLDWVAAGRGEAMGDVATTSLLLRFGRVSPTRAFTCEEQAARLQVHDAYLQRYFETNPAAGGAEQLGRWLPLVAGARLNDAAIGDAERRALMRVANTLDAPAQAPLQP
ncbi:phosphotransferase family protein [Paraburkholderia sediminicola]|uniref:phosphotransferase family protein n=1 Tax=Paraburkholderia sediminicola TaxID=458836 RepID=UPI0038B82978